MLRYTMISSTCLLLFSMSCHRATQAQQCSGGSDPNTGECIAPVDPNASRIANIQAQLDAMTEQAQQFSRQNQEKENQLMRLRAELIDERTPKSRKEAILRELEELGVIDTAVTIGAQAVQRILDKVLPPPTENAKGQ